MVVFNRGIVALLALLVLAGGARAQDRTTRPSPPTSDKPWEQIVADAKKEGKLVVLGPPIQAHRETVMMFEQAYPGIKVEFSGMVPRDFEPRITQERAAGKYLWDVLINGVSGTVYTVQVPNGWYAPIRDYLRLPEVTRDPNWLGGFQSSFMDVQGKHVFAFSAAISGAIYVNRSKIPESELNSVDDLLNPKYKGKIAIIEPRTRGGGSSAVALFNRVWGAEKTKTFLKTMNVALAPDSAKITEWAIRGTHPIAIGLDETGRDKYMDQGLGSSLEVLRMEPKHRMVGPGYGAVMLMDRAPNSNASVLFVNWLLTKDVQNDWAKRSRTNSRRTDVPIYSKATAVDADSWVNGFSLQRGNNPFAREEAIKLAEEVFGK